MNSKGKMKVKIIDTLQGFDELEKPWNELAAQCPTLSLYSSYDYNRIAWKHLSGSNDRLFVLALYDGSILKAIAPFCIIRKKMRFVPIRSVEFIANWEGDKPTIIAPECDEAAWDALCSFFSTEFFGWDVLKIMEQPKDTILLEHCLFLKAKGYYGQITHDSTSYYVDLTGTWESYLNTRTAQQKKNWRKRVKRLEEIDGNISVVTISQPERIQEALARFSVLEKMSWKGDAGIGIHSNASLRSFYTEFSCLLAERDQASFSFLQMNGEDIAGIFSYRYRDIIYTRHTAYNPEYSKLAPGIFLEVHQLQPLFGRGLKKYDMMGMHPASGAPRDKVERATGTQETIQILILKNRLKLLPEIVWRKLKRRMTRSTKPC
jgi:CelD/BcsL family acetyltransferase involved in cellulose biosynthesis